MNNGDAPFREVNSVLVTGGNGFLGTAIIRRLIDQGLAVSSFSRRHSAILAKLGVRQWQGDVADFDAVKAAIASAGAVIHTAAKAGVSGPYADYYAANVVGTENVVAACRQSGVRALVHTSSPSVVFDGRHQEGVDETAPSPGKFLAAYPETKARAERAALAADDGGRLAVCALRPHLIWGPDDPHLVPRVVALAKAGQLRFVGAGERLVDAVFIDNAADAHVIALAALLSERSSLVRGRPFFVTNHEPWPMREILNAILVAAGLPPESRSVPPKIAWVVGAVLEALHGTLRLKSEPRMTRFVSRQLATAHWYDPSEQRERLGYIPKISMRAGFALLSQHFQTSSGTAPPGCLTN